MLRRFNIAILGLRGMLGLLLLKLRAVILIEFDSHSVVRHFVGWGPVSAQTLSGVVFFRSDVGP